MAKTMPIRTAAATITKSPTKTDSRFPAITSSFPCWCSSQAAVLREHLQIIHFARHFRLGHAVQELAYARLRAGAHFRGGADGHDVALVDQHHTIGDQVSAGQFVSDDDNGHAEGLLQFQN